MLVALSVVAALIVSCWPIIFTMLRQAASFSSIKRCLHIHNNSRHCPATGAGLMHGPTHIQLSPKLFAACCLLSQ
ncbi:hypothetical protein BX667DRAFT_499050 [Coemansia mojavensis]|nr:hypothetical protein BX667DRAFT_499050 [Coemansia mojavensis]